MSDSDPSGAETTSAETASAPSAPPPSVTSPGPFSNNRGSGLARGKRPPPPPPQAAPGAPAADYRPTAVSILTAPTEYKNPFAPPAPAAPAAEAAAAETTAPAPTPVPAPAPIVPAIPATEASTAPSVPIVESRPPAVESTPVESAVAEPKAELKILPPEAPRRVEHNWESESFPTAASQPGSEPGRPTEPRSAEQRPRREDRRGDRPYFRSERERRDDRPLESREPRTDSAPTAQISDTGRPHNESVPAPAPEESKKSGGMFGWVKKLFGGTPAEAPKPESQPASPGQRDFNPDGPYRRRRRRGGRNRNFQGDQRGPREGQPGGQQGGGQPSGDQQGYGGEQRGYSGDQRGYGGENRNQGNRRHRHHGGGFRGNGRLEGGPPPAGS